MSLRPRPRHQTGFFLPAHTPRDLRHGYACQCDDPRETSPCKPRVLPSGLVRSICNKYLQYFELDLESCPLPGTFVLDPPSEKALYSCQRLTSSLHLV